MMPTISVPHIQMPPPLQVASVAGVPSEVSGSVRLPIYAVPSTVSTIPVYNNTRGNQTYVASPAPAAAQGSALVPLVPFAPAGATMAPSFAFTSTFMAQVMGQGGAANDNGLIQSFFNSAAPRSPTPDEALLEQFSLTRFLPSNAARPEPTPQGLSGLAPQPQTTNEATMVARSNIVQVSQTQQMMQQPAASSGVNFASPVTMSPVTVNSNNASSRQPSRIASNEDAPAIRGPQSSIRPRGVNAYLATFSRNMSHLGTALVQAATPEPVQAASAVQANAVAS